MTDWEQQVNDAMRRLDDDVAAGVALPPVDAVIRRAGAHNRATTAAAAAVFTVGALGGVTVVAQTVAGSTNTSLAVPTVQGTPEALAPIAVPTGTIAPAPKPKPKPKVVPKVTTTAPKPPSVVPEPPVVPPVVPPRSSVPPLPPAPGD